LPTVPTADNGVFDPFLSGALDGLFYIFAIQVAGRSTWSASGGPIGTAGYLANTPRSGHADVPVPGFQDIVSSEIRIGFDSKPSRGPFRILNA